jgi:hypothetical protein
MIGAYDEHSPDFILGKAETQLLELIAGETGRHPMLSYALVALERTAALPTAAAHTPFAVDGTAGSLMRRSNKPAIGSFVLAPNPTS